MNVQTCKEGGAAFPHAAEQTMAGYEGTQCGERGMTLRDYFAAKAMAGTLANPEETKFLDSRRSTHQQDLKIVSKQCYLMADAMLAERNK